MTSYEIKAMRQYLSDLLVPARSALLHGVLDDYADKISLDGAAQVLTSDVLLAESLTQWITSAYRDMPHSITIPKSSAAEPLPPALVQKASAKIVTTTPDDTFTHAIFEIGVDTELTTGRQAALEVLKSIYYALKPKGFTIVMYVSTDASKRMLDRVLRRLGKGEIADWGLGQIDLGKEELIDLAEEAQFERGKIRWSERRIALGRDVQDKITAGFVTRMKKIQSGAQDDCWRDSLEAAWAEETKDGGGLIFEAQLLLAMKWDLLCA